MLCKLSLSNLRRSLRDYAIYFFTLIIGVSVFYVFNAIGSQTAMMQMSESQYEIIRLLETSLSGTSVFVAGVLGLLIVYASRFLMKRRSKEFALYMMLGMSKGSISAILLIETLLIGFGSLLIGLLIGIGLSQIMSALVANLFEADMTRYRFTVSGSAILKTILYFAVMYLVVMIFNSVVVTRMKLIDLLHSGKRSEQIRLKNPVVCVIVFLLAAGLLGYAYYQVGWNMKHIERNTMALYIAMGSAATFFIFWSVSGMLLRVMMSMRSVYHRGLNAFTFRQISSKVNTMVFSMTVICLMLFVTICTLASAFSIRNSMNANIKELCPADYQIITYHSSWDEAYQDDTLAEIFAENGCDLTADTADAVDLFTYTVPGLTFGTSLGDAYQEIQSMYMFLNYDSPEEFIKLSDYNKLMQLYGRETLSLDEGEYILLCNFTSMKNLRGSALRAGGELTVCGQTLKPKYTECKEGAIEIAAERINVGLFVVQDAVLEDASVYKEYFTGNYAAQTQDEIQAVEARKRETFSQVREAWESAHADLNLGGINTRIDIYEASVGLGAVVTFLGLYIGLVFLIASGAVLALKELSESVDSIGRYEMLRKIGAEEREISGSLFWQTGIFFLLPLLLAIVHSIFGMKFTTFFLEVLGTGHIAESITATSVILLLIYGGYFLVTYFCSKGIIQEKR